MTEYRAPLADIDFVLNRVCGLDRILALPGFIDADSAMVRDLLQEAARFMEEQLAPLNKSGDSFGVKLNSDGSVVTAPGFVEAYRAYVEAGWEQFLSIRVLVAADSRGWWVLLFKRL